MVLHAWEETLEDRFVADHFLAVVKTFDEEATRRGGGDFFSPYTVS